MSGARSQAVWVAAAAAGWSGVGRAASKGEDRQALAALILWVSQSSTGALRIKMHNKLTICRRIAPIGASRA